MDEKDQKEPRIKIDPLPEKNKNTALTKQEQKRIETEGKNALLPIKDGRAQAMPKKEPSTTAKPEPRTYASGKKIGRPPKPENQKKTNDTYTLTPARKRALEKARVMKSLKAEEKKRGAPPTAVDFKQDVINTEIGEDPSAIKDAYRTIEKPEKFNPLQHETSNKQLGFGMNGKPSIFDVYDNKIRELEQQMTTLKIKGHLATTDIEYPERKGIDQITGVNNTFRQNNPSSIGFIKKNDISIHKGKQQSASTIHNKNPFTAKRK